VYLIFLNKGVFKEKTKARSLSRKSTGKKTRLSPEQKSLTKPISPHKNVWQKPV